MTQLSSLTGGGSGATLLHEVMSFLRRCLTQVKRLRVQQTAKAWAEGMPARHHALRLRCPLPSAALPPPPQQPEVRRAVYDGMPTLLAADPAVQVRLWRYCRGPLPLNAGRLSTPVCIIAAKHMVPACLPGCPRPCRTAWWSRCCRTSWPFMRRTRS